MSNTQAFHADLRIDGHRIPVIIVAEADFTHGDRSVGESRGHIVTNAHIEQSELLQQTVNHIYFGEDEGALDLEVDIVFGSDRVISNTLDAFIEPAGRGVSIALTLVDTNGLFAAFAELVDAVEENSTLLADSLPPFPTARREGL